MIQLLPTMIKSIVVDSVRQTLAKKVKMKVPAPMKSKKMIMSLLGVALTACNKVFDWGLNVEELSTLLAPILLYLVGQGLADFGKEKK